MKFNQENTDQICEDEFVEIPQYNIGFVHKGHALRYQFFVHAVPFQFSDGTPNIHEFIDSNKRVFDQFNYLLTPKTAVVVPDIVNKVLERDVIRHILIDKIPEIPDTDRVKSFAISANGLLDLLALLNLRMLAIRTNIDDFIEELLCQ